MQSNLLSTSLPYAACNNYNHHHHKVVVVIISWIGLHRCGQLRVSRYLADSVAFSRWKLVLNVLFSISIIF